MSDALSIAASGLKCEEYLIDTIANDLANLNTPNYKASSVTFEDVLYQNIHGVQADAHNIQVGLGAAVTQSHKDFSAGPLKSTNNWNDTAINGNGFYQAITPSGDIVYTRNATLSIDSEHYLATQDGLRLADNIQIPDDFIAITIESNGEVSATQANSSEPQILGTIQLARFINPESLTIIGEGKYSASDVSGDPVIDNPGSSGLGLLAQHQIEHSNVDMVNSLMQLTMAQRVYQLNAKAVQIADELEKMTNEIRN
jgi:flagellar basal-body rod protein FlgG